MRKFADARAPLFASSDCYGLDADMTRMTPMIAAARCSYSSAVTTTEIETPDHSQPRGLLRRVKQPDGAINTEKPQQPRREMIRRPPFSVRITTSVHQRPLRISRRPSGATRVRRPSGLL